MHLKPACFEWIRLCSRNKYGRRNRLPQTLHSKLSFFSGFTWWLTRSCVAKSRFVVNVRLQWLHLCSFLMCFFWSVSTIFFRLPKSPSKVTETPWIWARWWMILSLLNTWSHSTHVANWSEPLQRCRIKSPRVGNNRQQFTQVMLFLALER